MREKKQHQIRLLLFAFTTLLIMAFIFVMSAQNSSGSAQMSKGFLRTLVGRLLGALLPKLSEKGLEHDIRKYAHMFEFACLGISACLFFRELLLGRRRRSLKAAASSFVFSVCYAATDEWHQHFVPGRAARLSDVLVDAVGVLAGLVLAMLILFLSSRRKHRKRAELPEPRKE